MSNGESVKLQSRIRRIRGQLDGIERLIVKGAEPFTVLQTATACRGALNGLIATIIEMQIRDTASMTRAEGTSNLIEIVRAYFR